MEHSVAMVFKLADLCILQWRWRCCLGLDRVGWIWLVHSRMRNYTDEHRSVAEVLQTAWTNLSLAALACMEVGCMEVECITVALVARWVVMAWVVLMEVKIPMIHMVVLHLHQDFGFLFFEW